MKVQCGQCPAKYAVADERIRDKKVRIHCKRCGASIVVDGRVSPPLVTSTPPRRSVRPTPSGPPAVDSAPPPSSPESQPSPRPVAHTILGGLEAPTREQLDTARPDAPTLPPQATGMPAPDRGFTDPPAGASDERWRVALTKQDLRWMTTEEIAEAYRAGAVKLETFVFRVGMPTWVTLLEIPEIARALGQDAEAHALNGQSRASSMPPPRRAPRRAPGEARAGDETDAGDPLPFALERASTAKKDVAPTTTDDDDAERLSVGAELEPVAAAAAEQPAPADVPTPLVPPAAPTPDALPPAQPFASNVLAQRSSDSKVWMWVLIVLAIAIAAALVIGPRFGFRLF